MPIVLTVALPVFALILTGWAVGRAGVLGPETTGALNVFVVWLALPAVLLRAMARIEPGNLLNGAMLASFGLGIAVPYGLCLILSRRGGASLANSAIHALGATFCNVGYMGIPLCLIAFGDNSLAPSVVTLVITACLQFSATIALVELDRPGQRDLHRIVLGIGGTLVRNPLLIAPMAGLVLAICGIPLPLAVDSFLMMLGGAATPCALVATGVMLSQGTERFRPALVTRLVVLKLLVQPAITWVIAFRLLTLPPAWAETAVLMSALPTGSGAFILARLYGRETAPISGTVLATTVLSFITLSLLLAWLT